MTTLWNELKPDANDPLSEFPSTLTRQVLAFREGIEKHFFWTESSGASAGQPRFSSLTTMPGSARAFYGPASHVSAAKDGTLMVTSDTSRLFATPSAGSLLLGSRFVIIADGTSAATIASNTRWHVQSGTTSGRSPATDYHVAFASAYSGVPIVEGTLVATTDLSGIGSLAIQTIDASGFTFRVTQYGSSTSFGLLWRSEGTVVL